MKAATATRASARTVGALVGILAFQAGGPKPGQSQVMDTKIYTLVSFEELKYVPGAEERPVEFHSEGWVQRECCRRKHGGCTPATPSFVAGPLLGQELAPVADS